MCLVCVWYIVNFFSYAIQAGVDLNIYVCVCVGMSVVMSVSVCVHCEWFSI